MKETLYKEENIKQPQADVTGSYIIKHPLFVLRKPRLLLYRKVENGEVEGEISLLGFKKKLRLAKHKRHEWVFQCDVDIITVDVVIKFYTEEVFEGFLDTPVGHVRFIGKKVNQI